MIFRCRLPQSLFQYVFTLYPKKRMPAFVFAFLIG
jgi:hypothetical protein